MCVGVGWLRRQLRITSWGCALIIVLPNWHASMLSCACPPPAEIVWRLDLDILSWPCVWWMLVPRLEFSDHAVLYLLLYLSCSIPNYQSISCCWKKQQHFLILVTNPWLFIAGYITHAIFKKINQTTRPSPLGNPKMQLISIRSVLILFVVYFQPRSGILFDSDAIDC